MTKPFEMPPVYLGQMVRWRDHPGDAGAPAIVLKIGQHCLSLLSFHEQQVGGIPWDGVVHEADPRYSIDRFPNGVWGYTEDQDDYLNWFVSKPENGSAK